jgi:hypothetical protein
MPATITLRLNDTASQSIEELRRKLVTAEEQAVESSRRTYRAAQEASNQYGEVIRKRAAAAQSAGVLKQAEEGLAFGITEASNATKIAAGSAAALASAQPALTAEIGRRVTATRANSTAVTALTASQRALQGSFLANTAAGEAMNQQLTKMRIGMVFGTASADQTQSALMRNAAILGRVARGVGAVALAYKAASLLIDGYNGVLARTGVVTIQAANATEQQRAAFERFQAIANGTGRTLSQVLASYEKSLEDVGASTETNLDRANAAWNEFGRSVVSNMGTLATHLGEGLELYVDQLPVFLRAAIPLRAIRSAINDLDRSITESTTNAIANTKSLQEAFESFTVGKPLADAIKHNEQMAEYRARTIDDFANLARISERLQRAENERLEAVRLASLVTVQAIDEEIKKQKEKAGVLAGGDQLTVQAANAVTQTILQLEAQKRKAIEDSEAKIATLRKEARDQEIEHAERSRQIADRNAKLEAEALDKRVDNYYKAMSLQRSLEREFATFKTSLLFKGAIEAEDELTNEAQRKLKLAQDEQADIRTIARLKREVADTERTAHELRVRQIKTEGEAKVLASQDETEMLFAVSAVARELAEEDFRYKQSILRREVEEKRAAEKAKLDAEKKKVDTAKEGLSKLGFNPSAMLQAQDPKKVREAIANNRQNQARQDFNRNNSQRIAEAQGDPRAVQNLLNERNRQESRARGKAFSDFNKGRTDVTELTQGQNQVAQESLKTMQSQGKLSQEVATALGQQLRATAEQQAATEALLQQVRQLQQVSGQQARAASGQRARAIKGSN